MHSLNVLQNEISYNIDHIKTSISEYRVEQENLECNLRHVRNAIDNACERYVEQIQQHATRLAEDARNTYQDKFEKLSKKILELEEVLLYYNKSLEQARQSNDLEARELLNNVVNKTFQRSDTRDLTPFEELVFEENVIHDLCFGKVESRKKQNSNSFSDSDFEIIPKKPKVEHIDEDIELQVKSIEMYHLTSESASFAERQSIDEIQLELKDLSFLQQNKTCDDIFSSDTDLSKWLRVTPNQERVIPNKECVTSNQQDVNECELSSNNASDSKVQTWLLRCVADQKEWSLKRDDSSISVKSATSLVFEEFDNAPVSHWLVGRTNQDADSVASIQPTTKWLINSPQRKNPLSQSIISSKDTFENENKKYLQVTSEASVSRDTPLFLKHMNFIQDQPYQSYLRQSEKKKSNESFCEWLIGNSNDRCLDCSEKCTFDSNPTSNWLKTATDW